MSELNLQRILFVALIGIVVLVMYLGNKWTRKAITDTDSDFMRSRFLEHYEMLKRDIERSKNISDLVTYFNTEIDQFRRDFTGKVSEQMLNDYCGRLHAIILNRAQPAF
jgi:hypothetical protein